MNLDPLISGHLYACSECGCEYFLLPNSDIPDAPLLYCPCCNKKSGMRVDNPDERAQIQDYRISKAIYFDLLNMRMKEEREGTTHA